MTRTVVVSGGGTGIGRAIARWFTTNGDDVLIVGRRESVLATTAAEVGARWMSADLRTAGGAQSVADAVESVDVVVANAGSRNEVAPESLSDVERQYRLEFEQNVLTAVLFVAALLPKLPRPGGRIIGIGSISAHRGTADAYSTAKAAMHGWIYSLAHVHGPDGITANLVLPGYIEDTGFMQRSAQWHADANRAPIGRAGRSAEVASAVGYLASESASFVSAQILGVNGGFVPGR